MLENSEPVFDPDLLSLLKSIGNQLAVMKDADNSEERFEIEVEAVFEDEVREHSF